MKITVGVLVITSLITLGVYFYLHTSETQTSKNSPATATVSAPVKTQEFDQKKQEEMKKPAPELKSFEGLDEESSGIFNGGGGNQPSNEDLLKAAIQ